MLYLCMPYHICVCVCVHVLCCLSKCTASARLKTFTEIPPPWVTHICYSWYAFPLRPTNAGRAATSFYRVCVCVCVCMRECV